MKTILNRDYVEIVRSLDLSWLKTQKLSARLTPWRNGERLSERILHGMTGLCTESAELLLAIESDKPLDKVNVVEELGDLTWYCCVILDALAGNGLEGKENAARILTIANSIPGTKCEDDILSTLKVQARGVVAHAGGIIDLEKRRRYYTIPIDLDDLEVRVRNVLLSIVHMGAQVDVDLPKIIAVNVAKLSRRFPNKFSRRSAEIRDLQAEVDIMKTLIEQK